MKGVINVDGDVASTDGEGDKASDDESANEELECLGDAMKSEDPKVRDMKNVKDAVGVASGDENAQVERIGVKTSNHLIDQFEHAYFGIAFSFIFVLQLRVS